jgi:hypothetical protein
MPVISCDRVVDKKRIIGKMEGREGGEAQGVTDLPSPPQKKGFISGWSLVTWLELLTNRNKLWPGFGDLDAVARLDSWTGVGNHWTVQAYSC